MTRFISRRGALQQTLIWPAMALASCSGGCGGGGGGGTGDTGDAGGGSGGGGSSGGGGGSSGTGPLRATPINGAVQYLTHDGDAVGDVPNTSAPTRDAWNRVLNFQWKRGAWGDWTDADQKPFGTSTVGATPYASLPVPRPGRYNVDVTTLVQRWWTQPNRGLYLRMRNNAFAVQFAGRTAADVSTQPKLVVRTSTGTYELNARANAHWFTTTFRAGSNAENWKLSGQSPAILQFDLAPVSGTLTSASLHISSVSHDNGSTMAQGIVDIFEADPPAIVVPDTPSNPRYGIARGLGGFQALERHQEVLFSDDFATPGWADGGWDQPVERGVNTITGTTYARGRFVAGRNESANLRRDVTRGTGPGGTPDSVIPELFGQYWLLLEPNFGSNVDAIKIPAMGLQFGYWSSGFGYWQQTTGNGGSRGTGMKVFNVVQNKYEYQGHSIRLLVGMKPADRSDYGHLLSLAVYPYNLDQAGPFPASEQIPYVAIRREQWYAIDIRIKQNSITGPFDALGNGSAVADGVMELWVNGHLSYSRTNYRWRRHPEFGVQGMWIDFYHGGTQPAPYTMNYRVDRVTLARSYIGPP